jgi:hypothetical protein
MPSSIHALSDELLRLHRADMAGQGRAVAEDLTPWPFIPPRHAFVSIWMPLSSKNADFR